MLCHMSGDKQCAGDWHVAACATGDAAEYWQSHTAPVSLCKPAYTRCDPTASQATPAQGGNAHMW